MNNCGVVKIAGKVKKGCGLDRLIINGTKGLEVSTAVWTGLNSRASAARPLGELMGSCRGGGRCDKRRASGNRAGEGRGGGTGAAGGLKAVGDDGSE